MTKKELEAIRYRAVGSDRADDVAALLAEVERLELALVAIVHVMDVRGRARNPQGTMLWDNNRLGSNDYWDGLKAGIITGLTVIVGGLITVAAVAGVYFSLLRK